MTRARSLFFVLTLVSFIGFFVPFTLTAWSRTLLTLPVSALLIASWWYGHRRGKAPWYTDFVDAACFVVLVTSTPQPITILSFTFSALWYRSMYGSTVRAFLRLALIEASIALGLFIWPTFNTGLPLSDGKPIYPVFAMMILNVAVIRVLASGLRGHDEAAQRESVVAAFGAELLAVENDGRIQSMSWTALTELCDKTPGLSIALVVPDGDEFRVTRSHGPRSVPLLNPVMPGTANGSSGSVLQGQFPLSGGGRNGWTHLRLPQATMESWLFIGGSGKTIQEGLPAVQAVVHNTALAMRNVQSRDALRTQARTDPLTGLANRVAFHDALEREVAQAWGGEGIESTALLFIDLDGFKAVNDSLGHAAGDTLLRTVAKRMQEVVREDDLCARLGGDEFAVLLPGIGKEDATGIAHRIVEFLGEPIMLSGVTAQIGASIGVAFSVSAAGGDALIRQADSAMYSAKAAGKGCVVLHT
ncbi:MAG: diguanylate cyclase domain-containing protein [Janthinobacterium lividum]